LPVNLWGAQCALFFLCLSNALPRGSTLAAQRRCGRSVAYFFGCSRAIPDIAAPDLFG
jgi:hypothetical protein